MQANIESFVCVVKGWGSLLLLWLHFANKCLHFHFSGFLGLIERVGADKGGHWKVCRKRNSVLYSEVPPQAPFNVGFEVAIKERRELVVWYFVG